MGDKRLYQGISLPLAGVLLIMSFLSLAGCDSRISGKVEETDSRPFYNDRVVTVRIVMSQEDWAFTQKNATAEQYVKADLWYDGELIPSIAVRPKGNSSLRSAARDGLRLPLKIDLNFFNSARTLYGVKKLSFNNGFSDPTLIREVLAYELFEQMGLPTPRASFVDLWVNDNHLGLYTMVEQIDKTFLTRNFTDNSGNLYKPQTSAAYLNWTEEDLGNLEIASSTNKMDETDINLGGGKLAQIIEALEADSSTREEEPSPHVLGDMAPPQGAFQPEGMPEPEGFQPPQGMFRREGMPRPEGMQLPEGMQPPQGMMAGMPGSQSGNLLEQMSLKTNENKSDHSSLFRFLDILNNEPDDTFPAEIEKVLDVDQVLRFLAVSATVVHLDNYIGQFGHNYYLYEVNGKFTVIPWDLNMSFGTFNSGLDREGVINFMIDEPTAGAVAERPLVSRLLSVPSYLETYHGYLAELINGPFSEEAMNTRIDQLDSLIRPYVENDTLKSYSTEDFELGLSQDIKKDGRVEGGMTPIGLKTFVSERVESIRKQLDGMLPSKSSDGSGNGGNRMIGGFSRNQGNRQPAFSGIPDATTINPKTDTEGNEQVK